MTEQQEAAMRQALEALMFFEKAGLATLQSIDAGTALRQALESHVNETPKNEHEQQPAEWEHLKEFGYAPGGYMMTCPGCNNEVIDVDKRASTCRTCAETMYAKKQQPADEPVDERALVRKVDAEFSAHGLESYTDVHVSRYRLLTAVRHFLSVSVGHLPAWLLQPAQAMQAATEIDPRPQPAALEKKGSQND